MNELFEEKRKELFILSGLILALIIVVYFLFVFPKYKEVDAKRANVMTTETNINQLETDIEELTDVEKRVDTFKLQKRIPEHDEIEKFLLKLEEIEGMSDSRVEAIDFTYEDGEAILQASEDEKPIFKESTIETEEDVEDKAKEDEDAERENEEESDEEAEATDTTTEDGESESKLKTIKIELEVNSHDYLSFYTFMKEIEKLERIIFVSELEFVKPAENELYFNEVYDGTITHKIHLQTFTYDG